MAASPPRRINYLRLSITDRCNLRCVYCTYRRAWELAASEILRYEELLSLVRAAAAFGRELAVIGIVGPVAPLAGELLQIEVNAESSFLIPAPGGAVFYLRHRAHSS
jgi:hypothetical protein